MIKAATYLASAMALVIAGCHSNEGNAGAGNAAGTENVKYTNLTPPKGGDWTNVINATPDGGVMMGNPNAKVHLIEIGSLTCPHCREFEETAVDQLVAKYVKTGQVSYEFRNYIRDMFDLSAVLIAKCNGPEAFSAVASLLRRPAKLGRQGGCDPCRAAAGTPEPAGESDRARSRQGRWIA